ncbi:MAG: chromosomal replication initiator protein DnaA [Parcubacteria bacterium C7867-005]|nr:MAG: chromosomal replication initiator protein DnaA [Parcubacteria bacterium C7867-005]
MDYKQLWQSVLVEIELAVSKANFTTWFKDTRIVKEVDGVVVLSVPNAFVKEWLIQKYHHTILKSLRNLDSSIHAVEYVVNKEESKRRDDRDMQGALGMKELPLPDNLINKDDNLNPRYTFETFVIGPFNELAHAAAQAVLKSPGLMYNPLFIYGSTGHGKTHLIQSIGNHVKTANPGKKVFYMTSEKFGQDCMNALQNQKMSVFKEKYRKYDVLIMDDIQFFSDKVKFQEELFHLFNTLYDNNKQIVFSSDKHPHFIPGLEERLKSRFSAGMIVDIPPPDEESRIAILTTKARQQGLVLSGEIVDYLAHSVNGNIRDLEGAINTLAIQSQLKGREITISDVRSFVKNNTKPKRSVAIKDLVKIVADFYSIEEESIYEKTRRKEVIKPRQVIMYLLREDFNISYPSIGQKLGGRDHTTVIHSCEKIKVDIKEDPTLSQEINQIRNLLAV